MLMVTQYYQYYLNSSVCLREMLYLDPAHALRGRVYYFAFVCVCVSVSKISQKISDQLHFWWKREETFRF